MRERSCHTDICMHACMCLQLQFATNILIGQLQIGLTAVAIMTSQPASQASASGPARARAGPGLLSRGRLDIRATHPDPQRYLYLILTGCNCLELRHERTWLPVAHGSCDCALLAIAYLRLGHTINNVDCVL